MIHLPFDPSQVSPEKSAGWSETSTDAVSLVIFQQIIGFGYDGQACQDDQTDGLVEIQHTGGDEEHNIACVGLKQQFHSKMNSNIVYVRV